LKRSKLYQSKSDQYFNMVSTLNIKLKLLEEQLHSLFTLEATNNTMNILKQVNNTKEQVQQNLEEVENTFEKLA